MSNHIVQNHITSVAINPKVNNEVNPKFNPKVNLINGNPDVIMQNGNSNYYSSSSSFSSSSSSSSSSSLSSLSCNVQNNQQYNSHTVPTSVTNALQFNTEQFESQKKKGKFEINLSQNNNNSSNSNNSSKYNNLADNFCTKNFTKNSTIKLIKTLIKNGIMLSVRELLLLERGTMGWNNGSIIYGVKGVVIYKGLLNDEMEENNQNYYKDFCRKQALDYNQKEFKNNEKKCRVILRDDISCEIISIYLPLKISDAAIVGLKIEIFNAEIYLAKNGRNLYLKLTEEIGSVIGK